VGFAECESVSREMISLANFRNKSAPNWGLIGRLPPTDTIWFGFALSEKSESGKYTEREIGAKVARPDKISFSRI